MYKQRISIMLFMAVLAIAQITTAKDAAKKITKPLKVYLLAGQSNMQGKAQAFTIAAMEKDPISKELYHKLADENGKPRVHKDVSIVYHTLGDSKGGQYRPLRTAAGKLSVGFGEAIGPELGFGVTMDEVNDEPIFIIKTAWGGKSLYKNFRPPSAGVRPVEITEEEWQKNLANWKKAGTYDQEIAALKKQQEEKNPGQHYRLMIKLMKEALANPGKYCPAYDPKVGYEIAGFVWFQGFNDMVAPYPKAGDKKDFTEYTRLMACFIRDVRKEFGVPNMPFVIGAIGMGGDENRTGLAKYMHAAADLPEFKGNVVSVNTAQFWDHYIGDAKKKSKAWGTYKKKSSYLYLKGENTLSQYDPEAKYGWATLGTPKLEDRKWRYTTIKLAPRDYPLPKSRLEALAKEKNPTTLVNKDGVVVDGKGNISQNAQHMLGIVPKGLENWFSPEFDDSKWETGRAPFGHGSWTGGGKRFGGRKIHAPVRTQFDSKSRILMRVTFEVHDLDYGAYRLNILAKNQYIIYLNGHEIRRYVWYNGQPVYKEKDMVKEQFKHLKKGKNVLAVYATTTAGSGGVDKKGNPKKALPEAIDVFLEAMSKKDADAYAKKREELYPAKYESAQAGISNAEYHYMGSAKIYSRIGEGLAKALIELQK